MLVKLLLASQTSCSDECYAAVEGSLHLPVRNSRVVLRSLAAVAVLGAAACGGGASGVPTAPGGGPGGTEILALDLSCQSSLLIGEKVPCVALARLRSGQTPVVSFEATWGSTRPDLVGVDALGVIAGRAAGEAIVTASYRGRDATARIVVTAEDALRIKAAAAQGDFRPGSTVTMWLQGYYSVASADTGRLSLRISDPTGTITTTSPMIVAKGGTSSCSRARSLFLRIARRYAERRSWRLHQSRSPSRNRMRRDYGAFRYAPKRKAIVEIG